MIPALALLLLTVATPSLGAQSHHPGPVVLLSSRPDIGTAIDSSADLHLGELKATSGAQSYALPAGGDKGRPYVWIYCEPFGVEVARAQLKDRP